MKSDTGQTQAVQPFIKLAQANMELLSQFAFSPEVTSETMRVMQNAMEQAVASATSLTRSHAYIAFVQGLMKNYTEFLTEFGRSAYTVIGQAQTALLAQTDEATAHVIDAGTARSGRTRHAA